MIDTSIEATFPDTVSRRGILYLALSNIVTASIWKPCHHSGMIAWNHRNGLGPATHKLVTSTVR